MTKMIPSGLKIDVPWEEEKFLEHWMEETKFYRGTGSTAIHLQFGRCSLLLSHNMNVLPGQWVKLGVHHCLILILSNAGKYLLPYGQFLICVSATASTSIDTQQHWKPIQQKKHLGSIWSGHWNQQADSWCWLWICPFPFIRRNTTNAWFCLNFPISLPGEFWGDEQGEQRGEKL